MSILPAVLPPLGTPEAVIYIMRLANSLPSYYAGRALKPGLVHLAIELNRKLPEHKRVLLVRDPRCTIPFTDHSENDLAEAAYLAVGAYSESPEHATRANSRSEGVLMLERYYGWCRAMWLELERRHKSSPNEQPEERPTSIVQWELNSGVAFLAHWIAALCPVIEGWEQLKLSDPDIDSLLAEGEREGYRERLFRFRHGVFHYQKRFADPRFSEFMDDKGDARAWMARLERAFDSFFRKSIACDYDNLSEWLTR